MTAAEPTVAEAVRAWPAEKKHAVLLALLREAIDINGGRGLIPVADETGAMFGYYVPPAVVADHYALYGPKLSPEQTAEVQRRIANPGPSFTMDETLEWLREADAVGSSTGELSATG